MTINFRRNALQLSVAALFSSAFMANAAQIRRKLLLSYNIH